MSARSSLSSGSGGPQGATDIIDLDRYMRSAVRPGQSPRHDRRREHLVVDAGGVRHKPGRGRASCGGSSATATASGSGCGGLQHAKHFSHDSGLSDGSNHRRRQRSHRRTNNEVTAHRCRDSARAPGSTASLLAFRAACERALREQQEQIARVAQLCERLGEKRSERRGERHSERRAERRCEQPKSARLKPERPRPERLKPARPKPECTSSSIESSDISSSSRSTRERRKDKHRTDECKTYKIIMSKLDELSRLFAARRPVPPVPLGSKHPPPPAPRLASSGSVSVSDKIVATEPDLRACIVSRNLSPTVQILLTPRPTGHARGLQIQTHATGTSTILGEGKLEIGQKDGESTNRTEGRRETGGMGGNRRLAVTRANVLEIAPVQGKRPNITTESVVQREIGSGCDSMRERLCSFELEDPVCLYTQAKRLQGLTTTKRRARSEDRTLLNDRLGRLDGQYDERLDGDTLCARCRGYWRAVRHCFATQLFCRPGGACAC